jgi:Holliday junction resolvase RusA-like endonuclease
MAARLIPRFISVADVEAVVVPGQRPSVSITVKSPPATQERNRSRILNGRIVVYDPSRQSKAKFKEAIRMAMLQLGIDEFPIFHRPLKLTVTFGLSNQAKDFDNLLKYVMDALQSVMYANDSIIFKVEGEKLRMPIAEQFTTFELEEYVQMIE